MNNSLVPREADVGAYSGAGGRTDLLLSISVASEDHAALRRILQPLSWEVLEADCCDTAFRLLSETSVATVICDAVLPDGDWRRVLAHSLSQFRPPKLIVASRLADERLWAEVLNLGGYDVLLKPFQADEVRRVVSLTRAPKRGQPYRAEAKAVAAA